MIRYRHASHAGLSALSLLMFASAASAADHADVRDHAEQSFQLLHQQDRSTGSLTGEQPPQAPHPSYSADSFLVGHGQGDLTKGPAICRRVSELAARADIAKQIRVLVKEHAIDRIRERTGREPEQDIEVVREELVQEYLPGVRIVDHRTDDAAKTCSAVAVMPKQPLPQAAPSTTTPIPPAGR